MALPFSYGNANGDVYARALGHVMRSYRLWNQDYVLDQDPEGYERLRKDAVLASMLRYRKVLSAGLDWYIEADGHTPQDKLAVAIASGLLKQVRKFLTARFNLSEAFLKGGAWGKLEGEQRHLPLGDGRIRPWYCITQIRDADKRRFRLVPNDRPPGDSARWSHAWNNVYSGADTSTRTFDEYALEPAAYIWEINRAKLNRWDPIETSHWIHHTYDDYEATLGDGGGVGGEIYHYWWAKEQVFQNALQFVERWAQGILHVTVGDMGSAGQYAMGDESTANRARDRAADWLLQVEKMRSRHVLVHSAQDTMQVLEAPSGGWAAAKDALNYLDGALRVLILGSSLPTDQDAEGGSYAMARVQEGATAALVAYDRALLEETLTEQLLHRLWQWNRFNINALGLQHVPPPRIRLRDELRPDPTARVTVAKELLAMGLQLKKYDLYSQTGFEPPAPGEDVIDGATQNQATAGSLSAGAPSLSALGKPTREGSQDQAVAANERQGARQGPPMGAGPPPPGFEAEHFDPVVRDHGLTRFAAEGERDAFITRKRSSFPTAVVDQGEDGSWEVSVKGTIPRAPQPIINMPEIKVPEPVVTTPVFVFTPEPKVNVEAPIVNVEAPIVNVTPPEVHIAPTTISVAAPVVNLTPIIQQPEINIQMPKRERTTRTTFEFIRDNDGNLKRVETTEKS